ncbi:MAG: sigma 54-interacting transcriptional regulator [Bacillota bacterium]
MRTLLEQSVRIGQPKGLHAMVAATLVKIIAGPARQTGARFLVRYQGQTVPASNLLALVSLGARRGEMITLLCAVEAGSLRPELEEAMVRAGRLLSGADPLPAADSADGVDEILNEATVTLDRVLENLAHGLVVVNAEGEIILLNGAAERYLGVTAVEALGLPADQVIPNSRLLRVLQTGQPEVASRQAVDGRTLVTNRTPIRLGDRVIGAVAVFQDISELERLADELTEYKALREKFSLLLDSVAEGICILNRDGTVSYSNPAFRQLFGDQPYCSLDGTIHRALQTGESVLGHVGVSQGGSRVVEDVHVVRVNGEVCGAVAITRTVDVLRELTRRVEQEEARAEYLEQELVRARPLPPSFARLIGGSGTLRDALAIAAKAAPSTATILIRGESGTGKELVAEAIHLSSQRSRKPFIRVNCAAIPPTLVESELFGHERGAFTGAIKRRLGKFELAHGGTIFLDEIGTLDLTLQAKLLRVLQNRELERVGGEETIGIDVRVIAATNADLEEMVRKGEFREDLYYRLNVIPIYMPPLRQRRSDIPILVEHFIEKLSRESPSKVRGVSPEALQRMMDYPWPGNVRQLENVVERALTLSEGPYILPSDLPGYLHEQSLPLPLVNPLPTGEVATMEAYEREIIRLALERHGSFNAAARALGLTHRTVAVKARTFQLVPDRPEVN